MSPDPFACIWEFEVRPGAEDAFVTLYNEKGSWVQLFRKAPGYVRTDLYRDRKRPTRFVTVDHWESEAAFRMFRERYAKEFDALDRTGAQLTVRETPLGEFRPC
jgi:heme-degrading monooxygenase HmoA